MTSPLASPRDTAVLFDTETVGADLARLIAAHNGREDELRRVASQYLKDVLMRARARAEQQLLKDRQGRRCAESLSRMQDDIIRILFEFATRDLYPSLNPSEGEHMAVVATGGYGRGLLAPGSDIDLLFLLPYKQTAWGESIAEAILYCLWDMGLEVGHATRSIDECIRQAKADMTVRTAILESRFLVGEKSLFDELVNRFDRQVVQGTASEFVAAKLAEREERLRRAGQSRYLVEPNVKDSKGGLRDLHTLFWIGKYVYRVRKVSDLVAHGVFDQDELALFRRCENFLWSVRCNMHFYTHRAEDRLSFDIQREIALRLGYTAHPGQKDVERFMKHYFLNAKHVGDLTAILCAALENSHTKSAPMLGRMVARFRRGRKALRESADFVVDNNRINLADKAAFARDPVNLIRIFHLAQKHGLAFHPDAMRQASRSLHLIDRSVRENPEANRLFMEILTSDKDPETVLRRMNECGVLGAFVRAFGRVVAMMQFNMYHHYTVDEHLIRCIGIVADMEKTTDDTYGLAGELIKKITQRQRDLLRVTLFLHDIAKGRIEDHSIAGARVARRFCPRLGLSATETEMVVWLIENHLLMSTVAQSRDLSDRRTIENFATIMQSLERLKLLTILTTADIHAVGPNVWNGWKAQLIRTLYYETEPALTGGFSEVDREQRVAMAQAALRAELKDWPAAELDSHIARQYPAYWLKVDLPHQVAQARFLRKIRDEQKTLATEFSFDALRGVTELTVVAPDHPRLLSIVAGACAASGANIVDAQIYTTTDGLALDTISVSREFEHDGDEKRRARRINETIEQALRGEIRLPEIVARRAAPKDRLKAFAMTPEITIHNEWSNRYTVVEITGIDRPGLLYELTSALSKLSLNITSAHVATFGERVVDVFYVTDLMGAKIESPTRQAAIKRALTALFAREDNDRPRAAAKPTGKTTSGAA